MDDQLQVRRTAVLTAVAMTILPGSSFAMATAGQISQSYVSYLAHGTTHVQKHIATPEQALLRIENPFVEGTYVNAQVVTATPDEAYIGAMLRVAHALASESSDIDADIAKMVDEEFWDLL